MPTLIPLYIIVFLYGIVVGSFLNVCICRIPSHESIVAGRSHCTVCGKVIRWYDLIPLVSFLFLKGRCRYCGTRISAQYPIIEFANGLLWVWVFWVKDFTLETVLYCFTVSALLALSVIDWRIFEIPPCFNIAILVFALLRLVLNPDSWLTCLIGFFTVSGFFALLYWLTKGRGIGGGDIKLMAVCGLLLGWQNILLAMVLGCILGSIIHLILMRLQHKDKKLAFGPYLSAGIFLSMLYGDRLIGWYTGLFR